MLSGYPQLKDAKWLSNELSKKNINELIYKAKNDLKEIQIMNLIEFGREVHAEMSSLSDAAGRTISVKDCILYCTTFPCHICAKHIIAAGIMKVVYIEPYPKSLARELFSDSITLDEPPQPTKVEFKPFEGIAPSGYLDLFWMLKRKKNSKVNKWIASKSKPREGELKSYISREINVIKSFKGKLKKANLVVKTS